ncbi:MAG: thiamine pyrophosphate-binding protein [Gammaproteobacteria bacterium]|nr:thiamine pyrophosphate-binding protein [Gammaproteobacteria bacterium]
MKKTAAWLVRHALEQIGVPYTFGIPGVHNIELYDELRDSDSILPLLVTHEGGASFMADAVYRASGQMGVLVVVPAAGLTHAMSGVGEAYLDGIPMLVISGGVRSDMTQGFQLHDVDQQALMRTLTKATFRVESYDEVVATVYRAWRVALEGEPGPVYVEIPANLQLLAGESGPIPDFDRSIPRPELDTDAIEEAARLLGSAVHPGLFVGWGARHVSADLVRIAERLGAPVATTLQGLAAFPGNHPLHTGMGFGPSAVPAARKAFADCDVMLAVGTRFAEICTGSYGAVPPERLVHIDINPDAIGRNYPAAIAIHADARDAVPALAAALTDERSNGDTDDGRWQPLAQAIADDKVAWRSEWLAHDSGDRVNPGRFFAALRDYLEDDAIIVADDGNHTFLTAELMPIHDGGDYLSPTDFNCMGYCIPATIGAKLVQPERQVVGIVGDGAFLMTAMEAVTAVSHRLGVAWFVFNDGELSQIAQAQEMPYQRTTCTALGSLDFRLFAESVGCAFVAIENDEAIAEGIERALAMMADGFPVVVDVRIDYSKKTQFTVGTVKTNIKRFDRRNKLRIVSRALWRKLRKQKSRS